MRLSRVPRVLLLAAVSVVALGGCDDDDLVPAESGDTDDTGVTDAELLGIGLSPRDPALEVGETVRFEVRAFYDDTSNRDITGEVTFVSLEPRIATVDDSGLATAIAPGEAGIVATDSRGVATRTSVQVKGAGDQAQGLALSPRAVELKVDAQVELKAVATYADGSTGNLAPSCTWAVEDGSLATVAAGRLTGLAEGRTTVRATCGTLDAAAPVTVRPADAELELPDLVVEDVVVEPFGDEVWVLLDVVNDGDGMSPLGFVDLFLDTDGAPGAGDAYVVTELVEVLAPGESQTILLSAAGLDSGAHTAWLVADADGWIEEADEANNASGPHAFTIGGTKPELSIRTFEGLTDGEYSAFTIVIENTGTATARDFWVDLWYDPADDPDVCDTGDDYGYVSSLAPGATATWEPDVSDGPAAGSFWLSVVFVDSCDDVEEDDEDDNIDYAIIEE